MFKFFLLAIGFILLFEGIIYFLFSSRINELYKIISSFSNEKIKSFSFFLIIVGSVIIYFTFRIYDFS
tara:strand:+ start:59 stop:262 length:204 start_codon:yes stop_codon:yes gene_type:complete